MNMRDWRFWALLLGATVFVVAAIKLPATQAQAHAGTSFAARMGCACIFIENRSLESCRADFEPGMDLVSMHLEPAKRQVRASVALLASRTARFGPTGCVLD